MARIIKTDQVHSLLKEYLPKNPSIIEAGAFIGHDTLRLATQWPEGTVHAFEPVPELFEKLTGKTHVYSNIHCYPYALSDHTGTALMHIAEKPKKPGITTQASSLHKPQERLKHSPIIYPNTLTVNTITIDQWATEKSISHVDFLWLDMQGHELAALKGAQNILPTVQAIYTEVNFIAAYEGQPKDTEVIAWIQTQGFKEIGRTFENTTDWFFGEVLFVRNAQ